MKKSRLQIFFSVMLLMAASSPAYADKTKIRVCVTVPDLGSLVREIAGEQATVTVFAKGTEDAHFVEAKPSFITELSRADLFVEIGMDLEVGWAPVLLQNARNPKVLPGAPGFLDASRVIKPLDIPAGVVDRLMGDVHPAGNPHFLLDPVNGIKVARLLQERLSELSPENKAAFEQGFKDFRRRIAVALAGEQLADRYDIEKLAALADQQQLLPFLYREKEEKALAGWWGQMRPFAGTKVVVDHRLWPYFTARFGLNIVASLEAKPGLPPTTRHLEEVISTMKSQNVRLVLSSPYYDPRHARFIAKNTSAKILEMAHQVNSRPGTGDYLSMMDYNIRQIREALANS